MRRARIFLVGISGAGKSTVGRIVAERLGWEFADSDHLIEQRSGREIAEMFATDGEARFREVEQAVLNELSHGERLVVSTGGGALTTEGGRGAIQSGFSAWLDVSPAEAARRLSVDPTTATRPLLAGDAERRLTELLGAREEQYQYSDAHVRVDGLSPAQVAEQIVKCWEDAADVAASVRTPAAEYPVVVAEGALGRLGAICRERGLKGRAFVVTDTNVAPLFGAAAMRALTGADYETDSFVIPAGEEQKTLATVGTVYDWLLQRKVERSDFLVCLGGGVVTDLAGFAAATVLRGIPFVHVPTTLLGMLDAAIGGKTGVDHPLGKNMVGAFAQPKAVVIDPAVLETLPDRQRRAGWAEAIKHGCILDEQFVCDLEAAAADPRSMLSADLIGRSVAIKAAIVSEDEREQGRRTLLNYGHTVGHAIEAVTGYSTYLHGEGVAIGMRAAGLIAVELGALDRTDFERQQTLIRACGLPEHAPDVPVQATIDAMSRDKKVRGGAIQWVLLDRIGHALVRDAVPEEVARRAVETVLS
jgi:shikimate kinase/3-dehydroquinate synthase